ncbi:MAG: PilZ domain-containing protein [Candidatus Omnitrophota bacterium]|nr:MAG: PilZ domain-containing protein [Candidatus Omnitrophota bacterium]
MKEENRGFQERRKYLRFSAAVEVKYTIIGNPGAIKVSSKNVGAGGLCLTLKEQLKVDSPLQLEIKIPDLKEPIRALGRVVWQKPAKTSGAQPTVHFDTGIEFIGISNFDRFNINRYVKEQIEPKSEEEGSAEGTE